VLSFTYHPALLYLKDNDAAGRKVVIKAEIKDILDQLLRINKPNLFIKTLMYAKGFAFYNPFIMLLNDTVQAIMQGSISLNPLRAPEMFNNFRWAAQQIKDNGQGYQDAMEFNAFSPPAGVNRQDLKMSYERMMTGRNPLIARLMTMHKHIYEYMGGNKVFGEKEGVDKVVSMGMKAPLGVFGFIDFFYSISGDMAWGLDRLIRMVSYKEMLDKGVSKVVAARQTALAHGDYSSVPPATRRTWNKIFFTPTFKIVMGKWYLQMIKDTYRMSVNDDSITSMTAKNAGAMFNMALVVASIDLFFQALDFEPDEFGRRYSKMVQTEAGPKELTIVLSAPHNLFLKYWHKAAQSFAPETLNPVKSFWLSLKWDLNPAYRVAIDVMNNRDARGQNIYKPFASHQSQALHSARYILLNIIPMLKIPTSQEGEDNKPGAPYVSQELGFYLGTIANLFSFSYLRDTKMERFNSEIKELQKAISPKIYDAEARIPTEAEIKNYVNRVERLIEEMEEYGRNKSKRAQIKESFLTR